MTEKSVYRTPRKMPSVQRHGFSAVLLLALFALSSFTWLQFYKNNNSLPSLGGPEYKLDGSIIEQSHSLHANPDETGNLPDLMERDKIPIDVNPTETLNLLGGPKTETPIINKGPRPPGQSATTNGSLVQNGKNPQSKTILINNQSLVLNTRYNQAKPLPPAPIAGLSRMSPFGRVPHPKPNGDTVATAYSKPFTPQQGSRYVSIIVGGLGIHTDLTQRAIYELPGAVSLSFAAHAPNLQRWINLARAHGHEVLLEIPMQSKQDELPKTSSSSASLPPLSQYILRSSANDGDNIKSIDTLLSRAEGYFAVTNYGGAHLVNDAVTLTPIVQHFKNSGLGFIYDGEIKNPKIETRSTQISLPYLSANLYLDDQSHTTKNVHEKLSNLAKTAIPLSGHNTSDTMPLGMAFSYGGSLDGILDWYANKPDALKIAPASYAMLNKPGPLHQKIQKKTP